MELDGTGWNRFGRDGMRRDGVGRDGMRVGRDETGEDRLSKHEMPLCFGNQLRLTWLCASCLPGNSWVETTRYFRRWLTVANIQQPMNVLV